jgi:hypothetical protein
MPVCSIKSIVSLSEHPERFATQGLELGARDVSVGLGIVFGIVFGDGIVFHDGVVLRPLVVLVVVLVVVVVVLVVVLVLLRVVIMVNKVTCQTSGMCNQVRRIRIGF